MEENTEHLMLEYLKVLQVGQTRIERQLEEHAHRLERIELVLSTLCQQAAGVQEAVLSQSLLVGRQADRLDRIERVLENI